MDQFIRRARDTKGFSQIILLGMVTVIILVGAGGFLVSRENKMPVSEKAVPQEVLPQQQAEEKAQPSKIQSIKEPPRITTKPEVKSKPVPLASNKINSSANMPPSAEDFWKDVIPQAPINLVLPLAVADIEEAGTVLSPYGIIRKSGDGGIGHGGIDFPLRKGSSLYAVAIGTIIKNNLEDPGGGKTVDILIGPGQFQGDGWIFKYDHVNLTPGLKVGDNVEKGQQIGTNAFEQRGNNHIGLEYQIKNFTIAREKICWVDRLEVTARQKLENAFDRVKKTPAFLQFWQTANEEGRYQYRGLLDETKYPNGPQLCYPLGTDARIPMN